jgi:hypothetical protein
MVSWWSEEMVVECLRREEKATTRMTLDRPSFHMIAGKERATRAFQRGRDERLMHLTIDTVHHKTTRTFDLTPRITSLTYQS